MAGNAMLPFRHAAASIYFLRHYTLLRYATPFTAYLMVIMLATLCCRGAPCHAASDASDYALFRCRLPPARLLLPSSSFFILAISLFVIIHHLMFTRSPPRLSSADSACLLIACLPHFRYVARAHPRVP